MSPILFNPILKKPGYFENIFFNYISNKLPRRFKRLIFISSIFGLLEKVKDPDMVVVTKLNKVLNIAKYPDAMIFPMYIKNVIWKNVGTSKISITESRTVDVAEVLTFNLATVDCQGIGEYFVTNTPDWLKYGTMEMMKEDVISLIKSLRNMKTETVTA